MLLVVLYTHITVQARYTHTDTYNTMSSCEEEKSPAIYVNGKRYELRDGIGETTLLEFLRNVRFTGTKLGCGEGGCGACTVVASSITGYNKKTDQFSYAHKAVNACLAPIYAFEGHHVITIEGLGNARDGLHPVQMAIANAHGSQCGFCTPGFVMSMYALLLNARSKNTAENALISPHDIEEALSGNLCRCTGYRPILKGFVDAFVENKVYSQETIDGDVSNAFKKSVKVSDGTVPICASTGQPCTNGCGGDGEKTDENASSKNVENGANGGTTNAAIKEPLFPIELKRRAKAGTGPLAALAFHGGDAITDSVHNDGVKWHRPTSLKELLDLRGAYPGNESKIVCGNTEIGVEIKFKKALYPRRIHVSGNTIEELDRISMNYDNGEAVFGAAISLSDLERACSGKEASQVERFRAISKQLKWFAGRQIRNVSTLGGNIVTGSPISDLNPIWLALDAMFVVTSKKGGDRYVKARDFFLAYRKVDLKPDEILKQVELKAFNDTDYTGTTASTTKEYFHEYKQSHRREDDIAIVTCGARALFNTSTGECLDFSLGFGGLSFKTIFCSQTANGMVGKHMTKETLDFLMSAIEKECFVDESAPGGMSQYRITLAKSFAFKFFLHCVSDLRTVVDSSSSSSIYELQQNELSSLGRNERQSVVSGAQYFTKKPNGEVVGQPLAHKSAHIQASGEAIYCDDAAKPEGCVHAALVLSTIAHGKILSVDSASAVESIPGVLGYFSAKDIPKNGTNIIGPIAHDEEIFATEYVTCVGQVIGVVVAETRALALRAADAVKIEYEILEPILSIEDAIAKKSYYTDEMIGMRGFLGHALHSGNVDDIFANEEENIKIISGSTRVGGQEHFYLEPNACVVEVTDNDEVVTISSTQCPMKHQAYIADCLGFSRNKVTCKAKRLGGGFGGKESRSGFMNVAIAVPAYHLRRPVSLVLDRDVDMQITGHRHSFRGDWKVAFDVKSEKILALDVKIYNNAGNSLDLSSSVLDRAILHVDSAYNIPNLRVEGYCCKTNLPSNTAFRGFGGPQGIMIGESVLDDVARHLNVAPDALRENHLYHEGDLTHFGQKLIDCQVRSCWEELKCKREASFADRRKAVETFNQTSKFKKRGFAATPAKFGIAFTALFLNQAGALVNVYLDGTVGVSIGGVEMGQGLFTKVAQIAAKNLGVRFEDVHVLETSTEKVPNASPTAASASSDMYGDATEDACLQIMERLKPIREKMAKDASFKDIVNSAYFQRIDLSAHGWHVTKNLNWDWSVGKGEPFNYYTYGAACSEVEVDCLTGDVNVLRTDIVMDVGDSINPALDIGQVEGGFAQGLGWILLEELKYGDSKNGHKWIKDGVNFTRGPGTYKIPTANDVPEEFNVTLLHDSKNPRAVQSSKAVGEPPFLLGNSVYFAVKDAIYYARQEDENEENEGAFSLDLPCTPERVRIACGNAFAYGSRDYKTRITI